MAMSYNRLQGDTQAWAIKNNQPRAEYANRVTEGKKVRGTPELALVAGNGTHGFNSRRHSEDPVRMVKGRMGQFTKFRKSVVRKKKNVSRLCRRRDFGEDDPIAVAIRQEHTKRMQRRRNRNNKARRRRPAGV